MKFHRQLYNLHGVFRITQLRTTKSKVMFGMGDMMGNMDAVQKQMREKLLSIEIQAEAGEGAVKVTANAAREILSIAIQPALLAAGDVEQLEDLIVVAVNRAIQLATEQEAATTQNMLKDMLPPGLGGLANMFK
jgi:DNA-binding YbaB/EbfC family protein